MIILNQIRTPDGTLLTSYSVHDYKTHLDKNGEEYMVDGGNDYLRRSINIEPFEELSIENTAPFYIIRRGLYWGTYGINGDQPLRRIFLAEMDTDHIKAVLGTQKIAEWRRELMQKELRCREEDKIYSSPCV